MNHCSDCQRLVRYHAMALQAFNDAVEALRQEPHAFNRVRLRQEVDECRQESEIARIVLEQHMEMHHSEMDDKELFS